MTAQITSQTEITPAALMQDPLAIRNKQDFDEHQEIDDFQVEMEVGD